MASESVPGTPSPLTPFEAYLLAVHRAVSERERTTLQQVMLAASNGHLTHKRAAQLRSVFQAARAQGVLIEEFPGASRAPTSDAVQENNHAY